jgi:hypothetical protein
MNFLLNRGGAGKSLTRSQSAEEVSKLMTSHIALARSYQRLLEAMGDDGPATDSIKALQKEHRDDLAKLSEIVLSAGGIPPRQAEPLNSESRASMINELAEAERALRDDLEAQLKLKHHLRTRAVLEHDLENTVRRIGSLRDVAAKLSIAVG